MDRLKIYQRWAFLKTVCRLCVGFGFQVLASEVWQWHESNTPTSPCLSLLSRVNSPKRWPPGSEEWRDFPGGRKGVEPGMSEVCAGKSTETSWTGGEGQEKCLERQVQALEEPPQSRHARMREEAHVAWAALVNLFQVWSLRKIFALCGCQRLKPGPLACQVGVLLLSQVSIVIFFFFGHSWL